MTQPELEQQVARCLTQRGLTLSVAESCTGGLLSARITDVAAPAPTAMKSSKKFSACVRRRWRRIRLCRSRQRRKWHRALRASMKPISALASPATPVRTAERTAHRSAPFTSDCSGKEARRFARLYLRMDVRRRGRTRRMKRCV